MPKQHNEYDGDKLVTIRCRSCGHTITYDIDTLVRDLGIEFQNELNWMQARIDELEDEVFRLTNFTQ